MSSQRTWNCITCTLTNRASNNACEACDTPKPKNFHIRFRAPNALFTLEFPASCTVGELKLRVESKLGLPMDQQRLYYVPQAGQARRELFGKEAELVCQVLSIKDDEPFAMTVEQRQPGAAGDGGMDGADAATDASMGGDDGQVFLAYLCRDSASAAAASSAAGAAPAASSSGGGVSALAASTDGEGEDEFADDDMGDWGDDGGADDDAFFGSEEQEELVLKAKQQSEQREAAAERKQLQSGSQNKRLGEYSILSLPTLLTRMKAVLAETTDTLGCGMEEAAVLQRHFRWNNERLMEAYLADAAKVQQQCGLGRMVAAAKAGSSQSFGDCPLCGEAMSSDADSLDLGCGHRFCKECWSSWLVAALDKGPQALTTCCPSYKCNEVIGDDHFLDLLPTNKQKTLVSRWSINDYVSKVPTLKWCVNPRCARVIQFTHGGARDIECECGTRFCFACNYGDSHSPCQCELMAQWQRKAKSEDDNATWLKANAKPCPSCKVPIEKNSGCNHMTCGTCKHHFCWLCLGDWKKHGSETGGYYACNKYESAKSDANSNVSAAERSAEEARAQLRRYQWHWDRTLAYQQSIAAAEKRLPETESRMETLQSLTGSDFSAVEFLLAANRTVLECRRALKMSYVMAYYLREGSRQLHLFQIDQGQLELFSDELHGLIELPVERLLPVPAGTVSGLTSPSKGGAAGSAASSGTPPSAKSPPPSLCSPNSAAAAAGASSVAASLAPATAATAKAVADISTLAGEALRQHIIHKTSVANRFLSNFVEAADGGQYIDLALQRLPSV